jgi:hypothetical protein
MFFASRSLVSLNCRGLHLASIMYFFKILTLRKIAIVSIALPALVYAGFHPTQGVEDGVDPYTGARPLRRNIEDLQQDQYSWYVLMRCVNPANLGGT